MSYGKGNSVKQLTVNGQGVLKNSNFGPIRRY